MLGRAAEGHGSFPQRVERKPGATLAAGVAGCEGQRAV